MRSPFTFPQVLWRVLAAGLGVALGLLASCAPIVGWPSTACAQDSDCGLPTLRCNTAAGQCEERCAAPEHLCGTRCARCCNDSECAADETCDADGGSCVRLCSPLEHPCGGGKCGRCCNDSECRSDETCNTATGQCAARCTFPLHWCGAGCAQCCGDGECRIDERCDQGTCTQICPGARYCQSSDGGASCAQCCSTSDCGSGAPDSGLRCLGGTCACGANQRICHGACVPANFCCDDCEPPFTCDAGACCDYDTSGDGGLGSGGCYML